jgi:hypothetical protein
LAEFDGDNEEACMKDELKQVARKNGERGRVLAARVAVLLKVYRRDPIRNYYLREEAEHLARRVVYHMRQAVIVGALIDRMEPKGRRRARPPDHKRNFSPVSPRGLR